MQTDRDAQIVNWLGRVGAAGVGHVTERFGVSDRIAYARLASLAADGLVERRRILYGRPGMYWATRRGLRWQGLESLGVFRLSPGGFEHAWQVAGVAVALHRELPHRQLFAEREIRALELEEGRLLGSVRLPGRGEVAPFHRPDLVLISPSGRVAAVEVELSIKAPARLRSICRGWARARHIDHVYYLASPGAGRSVRRAVEALRGWRPHHRAGAR